MPPATVGLDTKVDELPSGKRYQSKLDRLGITTVRDLLFHVPRRYQDTRQLTALSELVPGQIFTARGTVTHISMRKSPYKRLVLVEASIADDSSRARSVWFNQPYLVKSLPVGTELVISGKVQAGRSGLSFMNPTFEKVAPEQHHVGTLAAIYPETEGLTSRVLRNLIEPLLPLVSEIADPLPPEVRERENLIPLHQALLQSHSPESPQEADVARERIGFEELFLLQVAAERARRRRMLSAGVVIPYDSEFAKEFAASLPFKLTEDQRKAIHSILTEMADPGPMNRLLQGDVGSGKTVVGAFAAVMGHHGGLQTAFMAPTEILARQHFHTAGKLLEPFGVGVRLLLGSTPAAARREILESVASGQDSVLVGTHALIEDEVIFANLGLVVVDEQHRFGVEQRQRLRNKAKLLPNFLSMTATPIPRTLALTLYGDLSLSELREMPPGRKPVETRVVLPHLRDTAYEFVRAHVKDKRQVFVICPLIEESDDLGVKSATAEFERLSTEVFPDLRLELLHGRMRGAEKAERMARFVDREADILVSTSVVEVGVDVPNASIMWIEGAERFGLAQLHQFRGRVGRGEHKSFCLLFQSEMDEEASYRLNAVATTQSGFDLAEQDLRMRGPGDLVGMRQHGLPEMRVADLLDFALVNRARLASSWWLDKDPELSSYQPLFDALGGYRQVFDLD